MKLRDYITAFLILATLGISYELYQGGKDLKKVKTYLGIGDTLTIDRAVVNIGTGANTGTGDVLRTAFGKINTKFDQLDDSLRMNKIVVQYTVAFGQVEGDTTTGYDLVIPDVLHGYNLIKVEAFHGSTAGTRTVAINVGRLRGVTAVNMTSAGASYTADATINTANDDVQSGDLLRAAAVFGGSGTYPVGLFIILTFQRP